ncbi:hypothetical protein DFH08DRAFT_940579 [Mycena albidolilacea]|uniref:Uncharacterized protein n=1 Tax=Mycena albidolilacea TaxID=1033008 RepID=A0AAD7EJV6_9AGAR|nr:hypothetical protein DFH08DRAFT_940579 [Mycena albidolilacea]
MVDTHAAAVPITYRVFGSASPDDDEETYFAGGERSGISVQNPGRVRRRAWRESSAGSAEEGAGERERRGRRRHDRGSLARGVKTRRGGQHERHRRRLRALARETKLGTPTSAPRASVARAAPASASSCANINPRFEVDTTQPTTSIQVRETHRAHEPHTYGRRSARVYRCHLFFPGTRPAGRPYTIGTTFPTRVLDRPVARARTRRPYNIGTSFPTCVLDPAEDASLVKEAGLGGVVVVQSWVQRGLRAAVVMGGRRDLERGNGSGKQDMGHPRARPPPRCTLNASSRMKSRKCGLPSRTEGVPRAGEALNWFLAHSGSGRSLPRPRDLGNHVGGVRSREVGGGRGDGAGSVLLVPGEFQWAGNQARLPPKQLSYNIATSYELGWGGAKKPYRKVVKRLKVIRHDAPISSAWLFFTFAEKPEDEEDKPFLSFVRLIYLDAVCICGKRNSEVTPKATEEQFVYRKRGVELRLASGQLRTTSESSIEFFGGNVPGS